jgi:hypothetical protein
MREGRMNINISFRSSGTIIFEALIFSTYYRKFSYFKLLKDVSLFIESKQKKSEIGNVFRVMEFKLTKTMEN